jgi:pimeloyl-ACP methyl ester carboxylesterase
MNCWQTVLIDFILNHKVCTDGLKAHVYLGSADPYYGLIRDEESYWNKQGANIYLFEKAGHYPHLESNVFETIFGNRNSTSLS